ncbi:MAG: GWxTD domain-containing protein [Blastocatellia bacterium]|nr:GWxTD domain-containing protein [Blastocatellia bacterium]
MKRFPLLTGALVTALVLTSSVPTVGAYFPPQSEPPAKKKTAKKSEGPDPYRTWIEEVGYILTKPERDAFAKLQSDEEREQFIEIFWRNRDPDPDTVENEYREEFYRRIAYANEKFASGIPGWKTDRGRIYITFGPPDSIEAHPAGGPYERPSYEGGGSTSTFPFEIWFYRYLEGVDSGIEIEFVDPTGSGEYRLSRSPEEKDALLFTPNGGLTLSEQLGLSSKKDRPFFNPANRNLSGRRQDQPFERIIAGSLLSTPPALVRRKLNGAVEETIDFTSLPLAVRTDLFRAGENTGVAAFTLNLANADLSFKNLGGLHQAQLNVYGQIRALSGRRVGSFEDTASISLANQDLSAGLKHMSLYQKTVLLEPGRYKLDLVVRDTTSGHTGVLHHGFEVPRYDQDHVMTSSLVLADVLEPGRPADNRFLVGSTKVRPSVTQRFTTGQNPGVFLQLYNVPLDQTTLKPALNAAYVISRNGQEVLRFPEDGTNGLSNLTGVAQHVTLARILPLAGLEPGEYELTVLVTDKISRTEIAPKTHFTIISQTDR